jgi:hypothetical protein
MTGIADQKLHSTPRAVDSWERTPQAEVRENQKIFLAATWDDLRCYSAWVKRAPWQEIEEQAIFLAR